MPSEREVMPPPRRRRRPPTPVGSILKRVSIKNLFGKYSYSDLSFSPSGPVAGNVSVLIGDNGSGKTTLLRLIYASLSPEDRAGLRTYVAKTPFSELSIELASGEKVLVTKSNLVGGFTVSIKTSTSGEKQFRIDTDPDGAVRDVAADQAQALHFALSSLGLEILFIDHTRKIRSTYDFLSDIRTNDNQLRRLSRTPEYLSKIEIQERARLDLIEFPLPEIISAVHDWFRVRAFRQGATGEQDASSVYLEVVRTLSKRRKAAPLEPRTPEELVEELEELDRVTGPFIRHGLLSRYPFSELITLVQSTSRAKVSQIQAVLAPFLTSIRRRIDALRAVQTIISIYEDELNRYFKDKIASFHILAGLTISDKEAQISAESLSSGERQLVFLLSSSLLSRDDRSLILIDEPELSLNYKWQRLIASSLSKIAAGSDTQFILASHSIEIISRHVDSVVEL